MPLILVAGLGEESGKTVLAASLTSALRERGVDAVAVKPVSGVDLWRSPGSLAASRERRLLVGGDILLLDAASGGALGPEKTGPLVAWMAPRDPSRGRPRQEPVAGRVTACRGGRAESVHWVNQEALDRVPVGLQAAVVEAAGRLIPRPLRAGDEFASRVLAGAFLEQADSCLAEAAAGHELVIVESQADAAAPTLLSLGAAVVLVAGYGVVFIVEGDRWAKAVQLLAGATGHAGVPAGDALRLAGHRRVVQLPFLQDPMEGYRPQDLDLLVEAVEAMLGG